MSSHFFVSTQHGHNNNNDASTSWVERPDPQGVNGNDSVRLCTRELENFEGCHTNMSFVSTKPRTHSMFVVFFRHLVAQLIMILLLGNQVWLIGSNNTVKYGFFKIREKCRKNYMVMIKSIILKQQFLECSLKELATLPCIARLRVRKETNWVYVIFRRSVWLVYGQVADRYTLQPKYCNLYFVTMLTGHITVFSIKVAHKPYQT